MMMMTFTTKIRTTVKLTIGSTLSNTSQDLREQADHVQQALTNRCVIIIIIIIIITRPKPAYGRPGLDWIVGPGYSIVVFSTNKTMKTNKKT